MQRTTSTGLIFALALAAPAFEDRRTDVHHDILSMEMKWAADDGPLTAYRRGDAFFEAAHGKHRVSRNASQIVPARFLAYFLTPTDEPLTIPVGNGRATAAPEYDKEGRLKLPRDFQSWVFVGANLGLQYRKDLPETTQREQARRQDPGVGDFHNVYINPGAYEAYRKTGKFPDRTVLVMDVFEAKDKEPKDILIGGNYPGSRRALEVAVKNSKRPDGCKTDWAYYAFDVVKPDPAKAFPDANCYQCHRQHASVDNVWVQFYPTLRDRMQMVDK
jgi:hypothetical protein